MDSKTLVKRVVDILEDKKAEDIQVIDLTHKSSFADYMVISTASSTRQVFALAQYLEQMFKSHKIIPHVEGLVQCEWVLIFGGDVVIHVFLPETRSFYQLEKMWQASFDEETEENHKTLR